MSSNPEDAGLPAPFRSVSLAEPCDPPAACVVALETTAPVPLVTVTVVEPSALVTEVVVSAAGDEADVAPPMAPVPALDVPLNPIDAIPLIATVPQNRLPACKPTSRR